MRVERDTTDTDLIWIQFTINHGFTDIKQAQRLVVKATVERWPTEAGTDSRGPSVGVLLLVACLLVALCTFVAIVAIDSFGE